ncbi:MAG TPA: SIS domain-containing protein [Candidatus Limnocylindrales bacterium]|nr:SIS domain-containing protein [Candidatus Limnocylindrales bacterium]
MPPTNARFDPTAPLAGAPDPWESSGQPSLRDGPPYHMTEMIAAEPFLAGRILERLADGQGPAGRLAGVVGQAATAGDPIIVTGCGTSEHAALAVVEILRDAMRAAGMQAGPASVIASQAFELSLDPPSRGLVIGISHEGGTPATNRALAAASAAGAQTALITASEGSPGAQLVETVVATQELDHSWCHTVGYLSPILAAAAIGAHLSGRALSIDAVVTLVADGARDEVAAERIADRLADARTLLVIGSGADRPAARELALKVEEASWLPSATRDLETFLHGHLPATDGSTGLVLILTDRASRDERVERALQALAAIRVLGVRAAAIVTREVGALIAEDLTPAGTLVIEESPSLPAAVAATIGSATPLQLLTERLARARGTNPDPIRRDDARYREASAAAE